MKLLEEKGFAEVTLTGVNIDSYQSGNTGLSGLLLYLLENTSAIRFRLSSLDPDTFTPELARAVAHDRVCPYFHLSVQSGSDHVLEEMNRRYGREDVFRAVALLRETRDDPFISADIIAGFPGETEEMFAETLELMEKARFTRAHVFPYSPRPGTPAFDRKDGGDPESRDRTDLPAAPKLWPGASRTMPTPGWESLWKLSGRRRGTAFSSG